MRKRENAVIILSDIVLLNFSFMLAYWIRTHPQIFAAQPIPLSAYLNLIIFMNIILIVCFSLFGLYGTKRSLFDVEEFSSISLSSLLTYSILLSTTFLFKAEIYSRIILTLTFIFGILTISASRFMIRKYLSLMRIKGYGLKGVIIFGDKKRAEIIAKKLNEHKELGYKLIGICSDKKNLLRLLDSKMASTVFVTHHPSDDVISLLLKYKNIDFKIVPPLSYLITSPLSFDELKDTPLITIKQGRENEIYLKLKYFFDKIFALIAIIILSPIFIIAALLIKLTSPGPILFVQQRLGYKKIPFNLYKFRTMRINAEQIKNSLLSKNEVDGLFKIKNDPRVTFVGRFLRRTCIDELPQLFNILKGDMSFVGPRPHLEEEFSKFKDWKIERFAVKPGITGLWQVSGRHSLDFERSLLLDLYYVRNLSFWTDMKILLKTIPAIMLGEKW